MPIHLLDVNILIALAWPIQEHHKIATDWFMAPSQNGWATCPMTQCGFVRISSNPKFIPSAVSPFEAVSLLQEMMNHKNHVFWPDTLSVADTKYFGRFNITGHRQITDAHLLELTIRNGGKLATMDRGIESQLKSPTDRQNLVIIGSY
jgi:toxin-antitoxin system PIN domain toxin